MSVTGYAKYAKANLNLFRKQFAGLGRAFLLEQSL
jgi:hypothetical protein